MGEEVDCMGIHVAIVETGPFRSDFAGGSLDSVSTNIDDYGAGADFVRDYQQTKHGKQPNDPAKFGPALCALVDADHPPLRLPLGVEAVERVRAKMLSVAADLDKWQNLSYPPTFRQSPQLTASPLHSLHPR